MVEITYPYIGEMYAVPLNGEIKYFGHVVIAQGRGVFTDPCPTEEAAQEAAERLLEEWRNKK